MDYKDRIQARAEEAAEFEYGTDFYSLPEEVRDRVYGDAMRDVTDDYLSQADYLRKREREEGKKAQGDGR